MCILYIGRADCQVTIRDQNFKFSQTSQRTACLTLLIFVLLPQLTETYMCTEVSKTLWAINPGENASGGIESGHLVDQCCKP